MFLDIWRSRGRYEPRGRFAAWLFTVARNRYIQAVQEYNVLARSFPSNLTAMVFSYQPKPAFAVQNEAAISTPPVVNFNKK